MRIASLIFFLSMIIFSVNSAYLRARAKQAYASSQLIVKDIDTNIPDVNNIDEFIKYVENQPERCRSGNDFNFSGLFRSTRPGGSFGSIFGLCIDGASGTSGGVWARFDSATSATKIVFYDGAVQTTTAINLPTSNVWTTFEIDWTAGTSTLVFKIGGTTVYSGTPTFTGTHVGFYAGGVGGTAGTKLSFDYITTTYTVTR